MTAFIADENVPSRVIKKLRDAGHDVVTVSQAASAGIRNYELAELSVRIGRVLLTRDADFAALRQSLGKKMKVIYIRGSGDPHQLTNLVLSKIDNCLTLIKKHNIVILDEKGCHTT